MRPAIEGLAMADPNVRRTREKRVKPVYKGPACWSCPRDLKGFRFEVFPFSVGQSQTKPSMNAHDKEGGRKDSHPGVLWAWCLVLRGKYRYNVAGPWMFVSKIGSTRDCAGHFWISRSVHFHLEVTIAGTLLHRMRSGYKFILRSGDHLRIYPTQHASVYFVVFRMPSFYVPPPLDAYPKRWHAFVCSCFSKINSSHSLEMRSST